MPENYFAALRRVQKQNLLTFLQEEQAKGSKDSMKTLLARFSLKNGLRVATLETYVSELKDAGCVM